VCSPHFQHQTSPQSPLAGTCSNRFDFNAPSRSAERSALKEAVSLTAGDLQQVCFATMDDDHFRYHIVWQEGAFNALQRGESALSSAGAGQAGIPKALRW
jgi:hypothetical protein